MIVWRGKISLEISPSFWVLAVLISWLNSQTLPAFCEWVVVVLLSVLVHELGHALSARLWGLNSEIVLGSLGGLTSYRGGSLSRLKEFVVVMAGPLFGFLLCAVAFVLLHAGASGPFLGYFLWITMWANLFWTVLNLLPVHPLDGGKLMAIVFESLFGTNGMRLSYFLSGTFAVLLSVYFFALSWLMVGVLLLLFAFESFRSWQSQRYFRTTVSENQADEIEQAERDWAQAHPERAISRLEAILAKTKQGEVHDIALAKLANYLISSGKTHNAYMLLAPYKGHLWGQSLKLFQLACYKEGQYQQALEVGTKAFIEYQDMQCAIFNAFSAAHLHDIALTMNWLAAIKKSNVVDINAFLNAEDFDSIRNEKQFQEFVSTCR